MNSALNGLHWDRFVDSLKTGSLGKLMAQMNIETDQDLNTVEEYNPALMSSEASEDDNPTYKQAMSGPNKEGYYLIKKGIMGSCNEEGLDACTSINMGIYMQTFSRWNNTQSQGKVLCKRRSSN
jgi:hypothetical protein